MRQARPDRTRRAGATHADYHLTSLLHGCSIGTAASPLQSYSFAAAVPVSTAALAALQHCTVESVWTTLCKSSVAGCLA